MKYILCGGMVMSLFIIFYSSLVFLIPNANSKEVDLNKKPLVLQWEVSHSRNTDQISLIFKQNHVELVTNTSSYQKGKTIQLGWFKTSINPELKLLREQVRQYYIQLKKSIPLSTFIVKDARIPVKVDPHAPVLRINEKTVHRRHPYFKSAAKIIHQAWKRKWTCVQCATYTKKKKNIIRTIKKIQSGLNKQTGKKLEKWVETKHSFSKKLFSCIPKLKGKEECIDPQFGIFEI